MRQNLVIRMITFSKVQDTSLSRKLMSNVYFDNNNTKMKKKTIILVKLDNFNKRIGLFLPIIIFYLIEFQK